MHDPALSLKLELLCAQKDTEIAALRAQIIVDKLRKVMQASDDAVFNPQTFTFSEPVTKEVE